MKDENNPLKGTFFDSYSFGDTSSSEEDERIKEKTTLVEDPKKVETKKEDKKEEEEEEGKVDTKKEDIKEDEKSPEELQEDLQKTADVLKEKKEEDLDEEEKDFLKKFDAGELKDYKAEEIKKEEEKGDGFDTLTKDLIKDGVLVEMEDDEIKDEQETLVAGIKKTVDAQVDEYINEIPEEYRNIIDHLKIGGTPEAYMQQKATIDYKGLDYKDTRVQEALVRANLSQQGYDQETVDDKVKDLQDLDKMEKEARIAGNSFDVKQTERVDNFDKQVAKDLKAVEDAELQEIEDITKAIDGMTEMVGFKLSKKRKEDFKKYLFDVDSEGETAASKASKDPDNRLKLYFLDFINYDFKDMEKAVATKSSRNFSKLINRHTDVQSKSRGKTVVVEDPEPVEGKLHIHSMFDRAGDD